MMRLRIILTASLMVLSQAKLMAKGIKDLACSELESRYIESQRFLDLSNLGLTDLDGLQDIEIKGVKIVQNVEGINLSFNELGALPNGIFNKFTNLVALFLGSNKLVELPEEIFNKNAKLRVLHLGFNRLRSLPILNHLSDLRKLHLKENLLSTLPTERFNGLNKLDYLDLDENLLSTQQVSQIDAYFNQRSHARLLSIYLEPQRKVAAA